MPELKVGTRVMTCNNTQDGHLRGHVPWVTGTVIELRDAHGLGLNYRVRHDIYVGSNLTSEGTTAWYAPEELVRLSKNVKVTGLNVEAMEERKIVSRFERF